MAHKGLKSKQQIVDAQIILTSPGVFFLSLSGLELIPPCEERRGEDAVSGSELNTMLLEGGRSIRFRTKYNVIRGRTQYQVQN